MNGANAGPAAALSMFQLRTNPSFDAARIPREVGKIASPTIPPPTIPPLTLSIGDASVWEGNKGTTWLDLRVTLSRGSDAVVTVNYATVNGTAVAARDYTATGGTLTFQPGQTVRTISVSITRDRKREPDEIFSVQLSSAAGAAISDGIATITILNDD